VRDERTAVVVVVVAVAAVVVTLNHLFCTSLSPLSLIRYYEGFRAALKADSTT